MRRRVRVKSGAFCILAATAWSALPRLALADTYCGSVASGWNAPNGAAVFVHQADRPGAILTKVFQALGEYRTHSMLSRGPGGWVTHATARAPSQTGDCVRPLNGDDLFHATPGLATIDQGAIYTALYNDSGNPAPDFIAFQSANNSTAGNAVGNTFLGVNEYGDSMAWHPMGSGSNTVWGTDYVTNPNAGPPPVLWSGGTRGRYQIFYGFMQYMNSDGVPNGLVANGDPLIQIDQRYPELDDPFNRLMFQFPDEWSGASPNPYYGVVCSTSLALWQHDALWNSGGYTGDVLPRTYQNPQLSNAANGLFSAVYNECMSQLGWFDSALAGVFCNGTDNVCRAAANQVLNGFVMGNPWDENNQGTAPRNPTTVGSHWTAFLGGQVTSISPDDIGCWNGNGTGAACAGPGSSIWGWDDNQTVQWNSGGNLYGCWTQ